MKYFFSAGEVSGDLHASQVITVLRAIDSEAQFKFLAGSHSVAAAGTNAEIDIKEMSVMGFGEVIRRLPRILGHIATAKKCISSWRPNAVVLIDYPSFNLKLAKYAHSLGIPVFWYISPKVWVWKEHRVKAMKKYITRLYSILPFEVDYFKNKHNWDVHYVGNPSAEEVANFLKSAKKLSNEDFRSTHQLPGAKPLLALLPGSRIKELKTNLPIMAEVARKLTGYASVIGGITGIDSALYQELAPDMPVVYDDTYNLLLNSEAALVTSGTATLETALLGVPQVMMYRHSGSKTVYKLFRRLLHVDYFSLPNLINNKPTIKELVMHFCTPQNVENALLDILPGTEQHRLQQADYAMMRETLGSYSPSSTVAHDIYNYLKSHNK